MVVKSELDKLGLHYLNVELGEAEIMEELSVEQLEFLSKSFKKDGLELLNDKKSILVEKIKTTILSWCITATNR